MFETYEQQKAASVAQEKTRADGAHSWPVFAHPQALTSAQLSDLRAESQRLGRPLSDAEREQVLELKPEQHPRVVGMRVELP